MNLIVRKAIFCLMLMIGFLILAFITKDVANRLLSTSMAKISGAIESKLMLSQNTTNDEKY